MKCCENSPARAFPAELRARAYDTAAIATNVALNQLVLTFKPYDDMFGEHFLDDFYFLVVVSLNDIIDPRLEVVCKRKHMKNLTYRLLRNMRFNEK